MAITLKRQLDDDEKERILQVHGRKCFATGHIIPDDEVVHYDHIHAFTDGGVSELDNIAPMCEVHNRAKGTLPLQDFRVKLRLQEFFAKGDGNAQASPRLPERVRRHYVVRPGRRRERA